MLGLHIADFVVLVVYLLGIIAIGIGAARLIKNSGDYFMPRTFGKGMLIMHAFGTGTHSDQAVGVASKTFTSGLSGIWYQWLWLFCTPFYWLIAPIMRRFRAITVADVFAVRYHQSVGMLFAVVGMFNLMVAIGVMLKGTSAVVAPCFGEGVSPDLIIVVMTVMFLAYGLAGGLAAAIVTDFIQGIMTIVFSFILLPFALSAVGGLAGLRQAIADPQMFSLVAPAEIGIFYIAVIAVNALIGIVTQPHTMGNCAAGRTESDGRFGFTVGNFVKRVCTMAWSLTGLAAVAYFAGREVEPDQVYGLMAREFLPAILPGLLGIFLAALLASVMSSCDSFMIASSALFTENVYKPLRPDRTAGHYLVVGRLTSLVIVVGGLGVDGDGLFRLGADDDRVFYRLGRSPAAGRLAAPGDRAQRRRRDLPALADDLLSGGRRSGGYRGQLVYPPGRRGSVGPLLRTGADPGRNRRTCSCGALYYSRRNRGAAQAQRLSR